MMTVYKTNKERWSVRPIEWATIFDSSYRLVEDENASVAIFTGEREAKQYAAICNACAERRNNERVSHC